MDASRLHFLDVIRGVAVLWMVAFQIADAFGFYDLYGSSWFQFGLNWVRLFWFVSGFSAVLMYRKYSVKRFWSKVAYRFTLFSCVGLLLALVVPFNIDVTQIWFYEAVSSIGLNLIFVSVLVYVNRLSVYVASLFVLLTAQITIALNVMFNPLEVLAFMILGSILATKDFNLNIKNRFLEFLGRHGLLLYVLHFLIIACKRFFS
ncbi:DUF1624 domain-containing protein [Candidatus Bathyarchaeota archaeon]|nr:MAG: DUF1624 domain-containing protein [Candidatus Bathyarchaeota archaeon]